MNAERQETEVPVQSEAQRRLMYAAMKDPKGTGIPRSVAEKFVGPSAHKAEGGSMKESKAMREKGVESKGKTKGKMVKMAMGGKAC